MRQLRIFALATCFAVAGSTSARVAHADSTAAAAADVLFKEGRQLHEQKRYAEACPKFAESYRLDPATGSLLALASCHEAEGKLASAWAEYNETSERARRDGNADRAEVARQRAAALEPRLAKLAIMVAPGANVPGLQIKRGAIVLGSGSIGTPLPIDRGEHVVEASAPNYQPWSTRITIADGATQVLTVPRLSPASGAAAAAPAPAAAPVAEPSPSAVPAPQPGPAMAERPREKASVPLRPIGVVVLVGGVLAAGAGTFFGLRAIKRNDESNANGHCVGDLCDSEGVRIRREARNSGSMSTTMFVVSGLLTAGGIVLFAIGGGGDKKTAARLAPAFGPRAAGLTMEGGF